MLDGYYCNRLSDNHDNHRIGDLDASQLVILNSIVLFVVDVYILSFFQIYLHPSAIDSPSNVLMKSFMKAYKVYQAAKKYFINHGKKWLNTTTAALDAL